MKKIFSSCCRIPRAISDRMMILGNTSRKFCFGYLHALNLARLGGRLDFMSSSGVIMVSEAGAAGVARAEAAAEAYGENGTVNKM